MIVKTLKYLVIDGIEHMYSAEMLLTKALAKLAGKASNFLLERSIGGTLKETGNPVI